MWATALSGVLPTAHAQCYVSVPFSLLAGGGAEWPISVVDSGLGIVSIFFVIDFVI